jgi:hypothetical protein
LDHVRALHFHAGRDAAANEASRRRKRLMAKTVQQTLRFAGHELIQGQSVEERAATPAPVIICGDYGSSGKGKKCGQFPLKTFLAELKKSAIVVIAEETCTTRVCGACGSYNKHPVHPGTKNAPFKGTVQCMNKSCPANGRYLARDVAAAASICNRFVFQYLVGGELGMT